jgi:protein-tyrosine sulfotransferase
MLETQNEPIFIFSCERSGSTLLRFIMDTHPEVCCPGQLYLGPLCHSLYTSAYYSVAQLGKDLTESEKEGVAIDEVRRTVSNLLARYAQGKGKNRWCEKTTLNIEYLPILSKIFPKAKFICLYRNCLDVIHSCIKTSPWGFMDELAPYVRNNPDNFVGAMAESWLEKNRKLFAFEQLHQDQSFRLTYESLVAEPNSQLTLLFRFLNLEWDEQLLSKVFTTSHDYGDGDRRILFTEKISKDSVGKGGQIPLSRLPEDLIDQIDGLHSVLGLQSIQALHQTTAASVNGIVRHAGENSDGSDKDADLKALFENKVIDIINRKPADFRFRHCICQFVISGPKGGTWILDTTGENVTFGEGEANDADCTITVSDNTFYDIFKGNKNPVDAYDKREIQVDGNIETALRYGKLLFSG